MKSYWKDRVLLVAAAAFFMWVVVLSFWVLRELEEYQVVKARPSPEPGGIIFIGGDEGIRSVEIE